MELMTLLLYDTELIANPHKRIIKKGGFYSAFF